MTLTSKYNANWMGRASLIIHPLTATWEVWPSPWTSERKAKMSLPAGGSCDNEAGKCTRKKKKNYVEICNSPFLIFLLNIRVFCCKRNSSWSRYLLLCFCCIFVPWACNWHLHLQQTVLSTGQVTIQFLIFCND